MGAAADPRIHAIKDFYPLFFIQSFKTSRVGCGLIRRVQFISDKASEINCHDCRVYGLEFWTEEAAMGETLISHIEAGDFPDAEKDTLQKVTEATAEARRKAAEFL
jgi:hypothetical protein